MVSAIAHKIPPDNPGLSGIRLTNYHYFYDLFVAFLTLVTKIPSSFFIYQLLPFVFSVFVGIGTYMLAQKLFKSRRASLIAVFLAYFASSFGWVIDVIRKREIGGESAFWANQPVSMNLNPPYAFSLVLMIFIALLIFSYIKRPLFYKSGLIVLFTGIVVIVKSMQELF